MKYKFLITAQIVYTVLFFALFPLNRYNIDPDGIAYLQQAKLYASGHFSIALNGCWSPLICWLIAPFIKTGLDPLLCFKYFNGIAGVLCILSFYRLSSRFIKDKVIQIIFPFLLAIMILSYTFLKSGPDVLQLLVLSIYFNLICNPQFIHKPKYLMLCGLTGAFCYFAKAYNFYFFIANTAISLYILTKKVQPADFFKFYFKKLALVMVVFILISLPYILLISNKYQKFTISTAAPITMNKSLEPGFTDGKKLVVPPVSEFSLSISDDPSNFQTKYINAFTSRHYFAKQIKITAANVFEYIKLLNDTSIFSVTIFSAFIFYLLRKKRENIPANEKIIFFSAFFYPAGYLLIAVEWRYIWCIPVLLMILASVLLPYTRTFIKHTYYFALISCVMGSFLLLPILSLSRINNKDKVYKNANAIKAAGAVGNFVANNNDWQRINNSYYYAYLNNCKTFGLYAPTYTYNELMQSVKEYDIKYFYYYYKSNDEKQAILKSQLAVNAKKIIDNINGEIIIFQLR